MCEHSLVVYEGLVFLGGWGMQAAFFFFGCLLLFPQCVLTVIPLIVGVLVCIQCVLLGRWRQLAGAVDSV